MGGGSSELAPPVNWAGGSSSSSSCLSAVVPAHERICSPPLWCIASIWQAVTAAAGSVVSSTAEQARTVCLCWGSSRLLVKQCV